MTNFPDVFPCQIIAHIENIFTTKFGIPRQSGKTTSQSKIVFEKNYRTPESLRGMDGFTHLWLIWLFSENIGKGWHPTVRPPRLGGNTRLGVFATRSPFRPNPIGLSSVKIEDIQLKSADGPILIVSGADLMNGTPILDIKPFLPFTDNHPDAKGGFADSKKDYALLVIFPENLLQKVPYNLRQDLKEILAEDPRPSYQNDSQRIYGFPFANLEISFNVDGNVLSVLKVEPLQKD